MKLFSIVCMVLVILVYQEVYAGEKHYTPPEPEPVSTSSEPLSLPTGSTYGLLALATSGNQLDWGVPDKLQLSVAGAFTEGGNQAIAFGLGTRFGGVLVNGHFATTLNAPDNHDDYAFVIGGTMHF